MSALLDYELLAKELGLSRAYFGGENGEWLRACCPLHKESRPSFGISTTTGVYKCFVCGSGTIDYLVSQLFRISLVDARDWLKDNAGMDAEALTLWLRSLRRRDKEDEERLNRSFSEAILRVFKTKDVRKFQTLFDRRFTYDTLEHFECGYDAISKRITFPVRNIRGQLVGVVGRSVLAKPQTRWKNYWKFAKSAHLFHAHNCLRGKPLLVVEGALDAARAFAYGFDNVVATLSAHPSKMQIDLIRSLHPRYVICGLDNDYAGTLGNRLLMENLIDEFPMFTLKYPDSLKDIGDAKFSEFTHMIRTRENPVLAKIYALKKSAKWDTIQI